MKATKYIAMLGIVLCLASCKTKKDFLYLKNAEPLVEYAYNHPNTKVHAGDKLQITVSSKNPELAVPFNANGGAFLTVNAKGGVEAATETRNADYLVDDKGCIEFPLLGELKVEGMTTEEVEDYIKNQIIAGKYITNPLVNVSFQNFRYTMLGAISNGVQTAEEGHITILQAVANAGGIQDIGNMKRVLVYREENGNLKMYPCDLTDKAILESPCYQLQQNDIVYVEPRYKKSNADTKTYKWFTVFMTAFSSFCSVVWAINSLK